MVSIQSTAFYRDIANKMGLYLNADQKYQDNPLVWEYENSKTMLQAATKNCFQAGVEIYRLIDVIQRDAKSTPKSVQSASLKVAKLFTTMVDAFLAEHGLLVKGEKKEKEVTNKTFEERQSEKSWESKYRARRDALEKSGLASVFAAAIPKMSTKTQTIQALYVQAFAQAYSDFTESQIRMKEDPEASKLDKAYKKARKGDPEKEPGFMPTVGQNKKVIVENWPAFSELFKYLRPIQLVEVKNKLGIKP